MEFQRNLLCVAILLSAGCATNSESSDSFLKKRLIALEKRSLVRYAAALHVPIPSDSKFEVIEAPLPEPDLNAPVAELVPWKN
jgi:hypothetical protein